MLSPAIGLAFSILAAAAVANGIGHVDNVSHYRDYFYTGGEYITTDAGDIVRRGQMYVERLIPASLPNASLPPIVFVHGGGQTGTNFLTTPDGRPGWASFFLARGHPVYLLDQPFRGRSPWTPNPALPNDTLTTSSVRRIESRFTAPQLYNLWPQSALHTRWPGTGLRGDAIFDAYYASTVPSAYASQPLNQPYVPQTFFRTAIADLLANAIDQPAIVLGHSQGGIMPWLAADAAPGRVRAIVALEPTGPPFEDAVFPDVAGHPARAFGLSDAPLAFDPPLDAAVVARAFAEPDAVRAQFALVRSASSDPAVANCTLQDESDGKRPRRLVNLERVPTLVVTSEASFHAVYDWCTVAFLRQAGVGVEYVKLAERGIHGNGHMFFMEENGDEIAGVVWEWIKGVL